ncbi:helix-turn-helix transcriptional regulator [Sphingobacterium sp. UT-1RO-CII-1]|uniref:helix-turn-helix domain-containing protein n=1 Tax=Sphingobacterium sp. UT-1RO-CII-1 TaxID=2995225 RepID=UPI00227B1EED|nr:helix-turn-helix transcriptional regulator [Sphingobacterium sp. UT-1RO-CII-1]MCY4779084.1 helix-turn-helix transcriptional regulator [Sphingobacterium sp. UT-1RO-CII-1]
MENFNVDDLLDKIMSEAGDQSSNTLSDIFEKRLSELNINQTAAAEIMGIQHRGLVGILNGTLKRIDFSTLNKLSSFLQLSQKDVLELFMNTFSNQYSSNVDEEKVDFIKNNFDLAALKKVGFIEDIADFNEIEARLCELFRLKDILAYKPSEKVPAFSAGKIKKKNSFSQSTWLTKAEELLWELNNPYPYDRNKLIEIFPKIRWYSTDVALGLKNVITLLYRSGISVVFVPSFPNLHVRGATIAVGGKPAIILTDYKGFYATLWFALIHELYHVLFDWEEISQGEYHLSIDDSNDAVLVQKELEADSFARKYLFSKEKSAMVKRYLNNHPEVLKFAKFNDVHPSMIYLFEAYDAGNKPANWARAQRYNASVPDSLGKLNSSWSDINTINQYVARNKEIYS